MRLRLIPFIQRLVPMTRAGRPLTIRCLRLFTVGLIALATTVAGCGGAQHATSTSSAKPPAATTSPSTSLDVYAASLVFTGGLSGKVNGAQAPPSQASHACGGGSVDVDVTLGGQVYALNGSASAFHGPGQYKAGLGSEFNLMIWSPTNDIWTTTSGSATYKDDKSLAIDADLTNLMAGPGEPNSTAHVSGSMSCG